VNDSNYYNNLVNAWKKYFENFTLEYWIFVDNNYELKQLISNH
jgi:hypothetical protein